MLRHAVFEVWLRARCATPGLNLQQYLEEVVAFICRSTVSVVVAGDLGRLVSPNYSSH